MRPRPDHMNRVPPEPPRGPPTPTPATEVIAPAAGVGGRCAVQHVRDRLAAGLGRDGRGLAGEDQGDGGVREADRHQDDADALPRSPRRGRYVRHRGVAGGAAVTPEHRRRDRLRTAGGALLHRHGVRAGDEPPVRPEAHARPRGADAGGSPAARGPRRLRGAAVHARPRGPERRDGAHSPRPQPRQHHHVEQRDHQADRLRHRARDGADAAVAGVRGQVSLRRARADRAGGRRTTAATSIRWA